MCKNNTLVNILLYYSYAIKMCLIGLGDYDLLKNRERCNRRYLKSIKHGHLL